MTISLVAFACVFGAALFGMILRALLPKQHLSADSKDTVRLGMGVIATMAALVLGLLVTDTQRALQAQASSMAIDIGKMRWLMFEQGSNSISMPLGNWSQRRKCKTNSQEKTSRTDQ